MKNDNERYEKFMELMEHLYDGGKLKNIKTDEIVPFTKIYIGEEAHTDIADIVDDYEIHKSQKDLIIEQLAKKVETLSAELEALKTKKRAHKRFTKEEKDTFRKLIADGMTFGELSEKYGVSKSMYYNLRKGGVK